jgi:hypothetical protein
MTTTQGQAPVHVLTLAMKERIRQFDVAFQDEPGQPWYCGDCLADLPRDPMLHGSHVCGEAFAVERAYGGLGQEVIGPEPGDVAWYTGELPDGYGRIYEVADVSPGGLLYLLDCGNVLRNVPAALAVVPEKRKDRP